MAERENKEGIVMLEEKYLGTTEETHVRIFYATRGVKKQDNESDSVMQPLLQDKYQEHRDETHKADMQMTTDGPVRKTSVPQELEWAGRDQPGCSGSVKSVCGSSSSRHECPICSELLDSHGDQHLTLLHCNHTLCHNCIAGIMRQAKDPGRLQCPFCRQTTPYLQWEIRRLQEESYCNGNHEPAPALIISPDPELQAVPAPPECCFALERQLEVLTLRNICRCCVYPSCLVRGLRLMRLHTLCFSIVALLLLFLVLLGFFLYMALPAITQSTLF